MSENEEFFSEFVDIKSILIKDGCYLDVKNIISQKSI